ncbi:MAG: hypothetical protein L6Q57_05640 [Alphaproteobacteria bacterium]|nr:hypothetical protein [Alphaproteobacteria bacterium]
MISAAEQNPDVRPLAPQTDAQGNVTVQPPQATLQVGSLPVAGSSSGGQGNQSTATGATYSVNKQAGIITVYATDKAQREVEKYLDLVRRSATAQVLIEAKILEVSLADEQSTGIDWRAVAPKGDISTLNFFSSSGVSNLNTLGVNSSPDNNSLAIGYAGGSIEAFMTALSNFGTVKALASPRLTVINNQPAVLNVATNRVFFDLEFEAEEDDGDATTQETFKVTSDAKNVPEGVLVNVQPSIDLDTGTISMALRPTITRIMPDSPEDPGVVLAAAAAGFDLDGVSNAVPELNVQEIDTVVQMRSGQSIVMGGLLQDRISNDIDGVPVLSEVPVLGNLFRQNDDSISKTEVVILLKATILENASDSIHDTDRDLYRKFSSDRRPFKL